MLESKVALSVGILSKLKYYVPFKTLKQVFVHSHLTYGLIVWGATYQSYFSNLNSLQNKADKIISGAHWLASSQTIYKNLGILDFRNLLTFETAQFMFNFV